MAEEVSDMIYWFWRLIPITILILFMVGILFNFLSTKVSTLDHETFIISRILLTNPNCLAYEGGIKSHPFVIDKNKFTRERLLVCAKKEGLGYKLRLIPWDRVKRVDSQAIEVSTFNAEQDMFYKVCKTVPEFECIKRETFTLLRNEHGDLVPAKLEIGVIKRV